MARAAGERAEVIAAVRAAWLSLLLSGGVMASESQSILLWPGGAPGVMSNAGAQTTRVTELGEHIISNVHSPSITVFLPAAGTATGSAVVVVPGGGHTELWMDHEGYNVAGYLAGHGVAAFVLKYRLARAAGSKYTVEGDSLADVKRAIRVVRARSAEWGVDATRVGVMGFSAGGELAVLAATRFDDGTVGAADPVEGLGSRPDFQALLYPALPRDLRVTERTPPAFLLAGAADQPAISQGLASLYLDLRKAGVAAELHIYAGVGHGFGLRAGAQGPVAQWPRQFVDWLAANVTGGRGTTATRGTAHKAGVTAESGAHARRVSFNEGWRFVRGDVGGAETPGFNDDQWQDLRSTWPPLRRG